MNINEWCSASGAAGAATGTIGIGGLTTGVGGTQSSCGHGIGSGGTGVISTTGNSRRESLLSPSSTRRNKLTRIINGK